MQGCLQTEAHLASHFLPARSGHIHQRALFFLQHLVDESGDRPSRELPSTGKKASFFANSQYLSTPLQQGSSHRNSKQRCFLTNVLSSMFWNISYGVSCLIIHLCSLCVHPKYTWFFNGVGSAKPIFQNFPHGCGTLLFHNPFVVHVDRWEQSRAFYARTDNPMSVGVCSRILLNCTSSDSLFQEGPPWCPYKIPFKKNHRIPTVWSLTWRNPDPFFWTIRCWQSKKSGSIVCTEQCVTPSAAMPQSFEMMSRKFVAVNCEADASCSAKKAVYP